MRSRAIACDLVRSRAISWRQVPTEALLTLAASRESSPADAPLVFGNQLTHLGLFVGRVAPWALLDVLVGEIKTGRVAPRTAASCLLQGVQPRAKALLMQQARLLARRHEPTVASRAHAQFSSDMCRCSCAKRSVYSAASLLLSKHAGPLLACTHGTSGKPPHTRCWRAS